MIANDHHDQEQRVASWETPDRYYSVPGITITLTTRPVFRFSNVNFGGQYSSITISLNTRLVLQFSNVYFGGQYFDDW